VGQTPYKSIQIGGVTSAYALGSIVTPVILFADDDQDDTVLLFRVLRDAAFRGRINAVTDGTEVVRYLSGLAEYADREQYPMPTLIILDMRMRNLGGLDTLRKVRERGAWSAIPIAVLSGFSDLSEVRKAYALGARTFFMKPLQPQDAAQICALAGQPDCLENVQRRDTVGN
jgi:CheY-like chemotaxis protein